MSRLIFVLASVLAFGCSAQTTVWQPSPGHTQILIWPGTAPDPQPVAGPESAKTTGKEWLVAGKSALGISNVTRPTMTVYSPNGKNTGAAVVIFPGGGYQGLVIDLEGTEVCDWLTSTGITCVLLKYRVTDVGDYPKSGPYPESPMALEDAQRTVGLVRFHAGQWHIDPHKVGVLGFSAGGHLVAAISTHFEKRLYRSVDAADNESCRPDFAVPIYPGHLTVSAAEWDARKGAKKFAVRGAKHLTTAEKKFALKPGNSRHSPNAAHVHIASGGRPGRQRKQHVGLLHRAEAGRGSRGDASVCAGRACVWPAAHEVTDNGMASVARDVARNDRHNFQVNALGEQVFDGVDRSISNSSFLAQDYQV